MTKIRLTTRRVCLALLAGFVLAAPTVQTGCNSSPRPSERPSEKAEGVPPAMEDLLEQMRDANSRANQKFTIGFNPAMLRPVETLAGTVAPRDLMDRIARQKPIGEEMSRLDLQGRDEFLKTARLSASETLRILPEMRAVSCSADLRSWDWRRDGAVSPIKNQQCGNCWAYASAAALESSYLRRNNELIDVSEQDIGNCAVGDAGQDAGGCGGGWHEAVFEYMISHGVAGEYALPDSGTDQACNVNMYSPYRAVAWAYVDAPTPASGFGQSIPTVQAIKQALCSNGPLAAGVLATANFQAYTGTDDTPFNETLPASTLTYVFPANKLKYYSINHDILLIGWDDTRNAWLIKNSWGTGWGSNAGRGAETDRGYMWIGYSSNNIGLGAAWVRAQQRAYKVPALYNDRFRIKIPFPDPGPLQFEDLTQKLIRQAEQ